MIYKALFAELKRSYNNNNNLSLLLLLLIIINF